MASTDAPDLPLSPYRVLDLSDEKGFLCGRILGDLGADVIKIEPPGGDPSRRRGPYYHGDARDDRGLYWFAHNYNKRGITLDLATADGRALFLRLAETAHFVVETGAPERMEALGLGYDALREANPALVMTSITPFGPTGPHAGYRADDLVAMAAGGLMSICGDDDRPPVRIGEPQAYMLASAQAATGTMLAHYARNRTGQGAHVTVSMQEAVANTLTTTPHYWFANQVIQRRGPAAPTADGRSAPSSRRATATSSRSSSGARARASASAPSSSG